MKMRQKMKNLAAILTSGLLLQTAAPLVAQQAPQTPTSQGRIRITTELVLVNVVARDKKGNLVRDLKKEDFTILEDGKKQEISTFDFESVDQAAVGTAETTVSGVAAEGGLLRTAKKAAPSLDARDRRLMLLFFDFSA